MDASAVTMKFSGIRMRTMDFEYLKISINFDKLPMYFDKLPNYVFPEYKYITHIISIGYKIYSNEKETNSLNFHG